MEREYQRSDQRAGVVRQRIAAVEEVATAFFREWQGELDGIAAALERGVAVLIRDMDAAVAEANRFIREMGRS